MNPGKIDCIQKWPKPLNRKAQRFLGFEIFYCKFIKKNSLVVKPLTQLTSIHNKYAWNAQTQEAFDTQKCRFFTAPILRLPDPNLQYILEVDVSHLALGAILSQKSSIGGSLYPVAYHSRSLTPAEINYPVGEKELLAVKSTLETWRHVLKRTSLPFIVYCDHQNLQYIQRNKTLSSRQIHWALFFNRFYFVITYRPGSRNGKADSLSHLEEHQSTPDRNSQIIPQEKIECTILTLKQELQQALGFRKTPSAVRGR